ncbi:hypothetical protein OCH239_22015 [Roseivivax halodurans JCM 10272]|uniref:Uncharacterized protein n=2 Tax=Roseivivax halodurans TaxID=93683 RepID=X7EHU9_9RHOB|nr:hypothetical protein OCH239_22015 [Roseivivax halodurans JCM 10272]
MWRIASVLSVPISHFFENLDLTDAETSGADPGTAHLTPSQARELAHIFTTLDTSRREAVMAFLRSLAQTGQDVRS